MNRDEQIAELRKERDEQIRLLAEKDRIRDELKKILAEYQRKIQESSNCSPDTEHPDKRCCSQLPCGCKHPEFYWIEENGDECCYYCRKGAYCKCPDDDDSDDE